MTLLSHRVCRIGSVYVEPPPWTFYRNVHVEDLGDTDDIRKFFQVHILRKTTLNLHFCNWVSVAQWLERLVSVGRLRLRSPRGLRNCFSEVWAWRKFAYRSWYHIEYMYITPRSIIHRSWCTVAHTSNLHLSSPSESWQLNGWSISLAGHWEGLRVWSPSGVQKLFLWRYKLDERPCVVRENWLT